MPKIKKFIPKKKKENEIRSPINQFSEEKRNEISQKRIIPWRNGKKFRRAKTLAESTLDFSPWKNFREAIIS